MSFALTYMSIGGFGDSTRIKSVILNYDSLFQRVKQCFKGSILSGTSTCGIVSFFLI